MRRRTYLQLRRQYDELREVKRRKIFKLTAGSESQRSSRNSR
jgi:hypothetical protein